MKCNVFINGLMEQVLRDGLNKITEDRLIQQEYAKDLMENNLKRVKYLQKG